MRSLSKFRLVMQEAWSHVVSCGFQNMVISHQVIKEFLESCGFHIISMPSKCPNMDSPSWHKASLATGLALLFVMNSGKSLFAEPEHLFKRKGLPLMFSKTPLHSH